MKLLESKKRRTKLAKEKNAPRTKQNKTASNEKNNFSLLSMILIG